MFTKTEFFIAKKYLRSKRKEGFISINGFFSLAGIAIGVATLIVVMSVMNGFRIELVKRILGINAHITIVAETGKLDNYQPILKELEKIDSITSYAPIIDAHGMAIYDEEASAIAVKGMSFEDFKKKPLVYNNIVSGNVDDFNNNSTIIMGDTLARKLGLEIGDVVQLVAPQTHSTVFGAVPRIKDYQLVATFDVGMYEYDSSTSFIPIDTAKLHFSYYDAISAIEVMTKDPDDTSRISFLLHRLGVINDFPIYVHDWQQLNASYINALKVERNVMFLILTLIIIVAAFNIISSLVMLVHDKMKNIALMRTMGLTRISITKIFFLCGAAIGFTGTIIGAVLGTLFAYNINSIKLSLEKLTGTELFDPIIYFLTDLPSDVDPVTTIYVVILAFIISFLAAIYPAWKASKYQPAEILRYE